MERSAISARAQRTVAAPTPWVAGRELQSGAPTRVCVVPGRPDSGVRYALGHEVRGTVVLDTVPAQANLRTVTNRDRCLCVEDGGTIIANIEHLNAVVVAWGVDNAVVVLEKRGPWSRVFRRQALPLPADSTAGFIAALTEAGFTDQPRPRIARTVDAPVELADPRSGDFVRVEPGTGLRVTCTGGYPHLGVPDASVTVEVEPEAFEREVSRARTLMNQYAHLPQGLLRLGARLAFARYGLGSGISEDAMLIMVDGTLLGEARYGSVATEFVRHKVIDFLGAAGLVGPLADCHFTVVKSSHRHDLAFFRVLEPRLRPAVEAVPQTV